MIFCEKIEDYNLNQDISYKKNKGERENEQKRENK